MSKRLLIIFFLLYHAGLKAQTSDSLSVEANRIINETRKKYAPDGRTEIFKIRPENDSALVVETTVPEVVKSLQSAFGEAHLPYHIQTEILPAKEFENRFGIAGLSVCNNRQEPDNAAEMVTQMLLGTPVEILQKAHGYYQVRTPDRYISWVDSYEVNVLDETRFNQWQQADKIIFTADYGHSYQKPNKKSGRVSDLVAGDILELKGRKKKFYKAAYPDGRVAYIPVKDAALYNKWVSKPTPDAEQILKTARSLTGVPYLWGGTSVKGVDCSGFTKTCYFLNGIILPRDASQQALVGQKIDIYENDTVSLAKCLKNLQAGDLLFFAGGRNRTIHSKVTHTAIYIGNGEFIQAAGMVRVNSMLPVSENYDDYQSRTLVSARRILTAVGSAGISRVSQNSFYKPKSLK